MSKELSSSAQKVQNMLYALGFSSRVVELPDSTRTAKEAAQAIGCQVAQIVKSLVFRGKHSKQAAARSCQWHKSRERAAFEGSHG